MMHFSLVALQQIELFRQVGGVGTILNFQRVYCLDKNSIGILLCCIFETMVWNQSRFHICLVSPWVMCVAELPKMFFLLKNAARISHHSLVLPSHLFKSDMQWKVCLKNSLTKSRALSWVKSALGEECWYSGAIAYPPYWLDLFVCLFCTQTY